jgi:hypothetical protein
MAEYAIKGETIQCNEDDWKMLHAVGTVDVVDIDGQKQLVVRKPGNVEIEAARLIMWCVLHEVRPTQVRENPKLAKRMCNDILAGL